MSDTTLHLLRALRQRLRTARGRQAAAEAAFGALVVLGALAAALLAGTTAEAALWMGVGLRTLWFWLFVAGALGAAVFFFGRPLLRWLGVLPGLDERSVAGRVGRRFPAVADRLVALLDLADGRASAAPSPFVDAAVQSLGREVEKVPFERVEDLRPAKRAAPWAAAPVLGLAAFFLAAPGPFVGAVDRLFAPTTDFSPPAPFRFRVFPGDTEVVRGEALSIRAEPVGRGYGPDATLEIGRADEEAVEKVRLRLQGGAFRHVARDVRADLRYRITADGVASSWYRVTVVVRPVVRALQVTVVPPRRTGERARRLAPGVGDVLALPGATVQVEVEMGEAPVSEAYVVLEGADRRPVGSVPMRLAGKTARGAFALRRPGFYRIRLVGPDGVENQRPVRYRLGLLGDAPPTIALLEGATQALDAAPRLRVQIADDYGFSSLRVLWRRLGESGEAAGPVRATQIPFDRRALDQEVAYDGLLRAVAAGLGRSVAPGDAVQVVVEVRDNDATAGFKPARTAPFVLRMPSLVERLDAADQTQEAAEDRLGEIRDQAREAQERFRQLRDDLRRDPTVSWDDRRQLQQLEEQHDEIRQQAENLQQQMQELLQQMREGGASEQTQEQYEALQQAMQELQSPELQEALERLREAMERMDLPEMMQAVEDAERQEQSLRERIERALALLERLEVAREMEEAAERAEDLARREGALRQATERLEEQERRDEEAGERGDEEREGEQNEGEQQNGEQQDGQQNREGEQSDTQAERERLAAEQQQAQEDMEALEEELRELQRQMEGMQGAPQQQMQQMQQQLGQQDLPQQMQQNQQQLQQGQLQDAQQGQEQMAQQLQRLAQQMQQMASGMQGQQQQMNLSGLRRALDDVLTLSQEQERLGDGSAALPERSPAARQQAPQQAELGQGLTTVEDTLRSLARAIPQMDHAIQERAGDAQREMGQATEQLADAQPGPASGHQKTAMTHLNDLALLLSDLMEQVQNQGQQQSPGGGMGMQQMMQQLGQAAGQQQGLNEQIQNLLNGMAGQRLQPGQQAQAARLAAQQDALRRQLQEIAGQGAAHLDPQTRSALQRAAEAMDRTARELRAGRPSPETVRRQEQILERLLEIERSVNQRGREERREGRTGRPRPNPDRPTTLPDVGSPAERLRRDLLRALDAGYAEDYETLIRRYFERLRQRAGG